MAFRLKSASKFTKTITIDYAGESVTFDYKPHATSFEEGLKLAPARRKLMYDLAEASRLQAHFQTRYENELVRLEKGDITDNEQSDAIFAQAKDLRDSADNWRERSEELYRTTELLDVEEVCRLVERWDVLDEDDRLMPTDNPKLVAKLPGDLLDAILKAIDEDAKPNPQKEPPSSSTSSVEASADTAPTGTSETS